MLKVELHAHTSDDPVDDIPYSTPRLIDRAAELGYHALAITLHDHQLDVRPFATSRSGPRHHAHSRHRADDRGAICAAAELQFRDRIASTIPTKKSHERGLVVAPHPFYPIGALREKMDSYAHLFDAVDMSPCLQRC